MLVDVMSGRCEVSVAIAFRAAKVLDASIYGRDRRDRAAGRHLPALRQGAERALAVRGRGEWIALTLQEAIVTRPQVAGARWLVARRPRHGWR